MKKSKFNFALLAVLIVFASIFQFSKSFAEEPWKSSQLMAPADLNKILNDSKSPKYYVYSVGFQAIIKNSIDIGPGYKTENINKLKKQLSKLPKNANVVVYCGCCPFAACPNIRPVFTLLNNMGFTNAKLLNIPQNIKVDWIDKGYSINK